MSPGSSCAAFAITSALDRRARAGPERSSSARSAPARRASSRHSTWVAPAARSGPRTSARWCGSATPAARVELACRGRGRSASHRGRAAARRAEADQARRCDAERAARRSVHSARVRVRARPPRAGEGPGRSPPRHLDELVTALWPARRATRRRVCEGAGAAQRAARPGSRRQCRAAPRSAPGTASWRGTASS